MKEEIKELIEVLPGHSKICPYCGSIAQVGYLHNERIERKNGKLYYVSEITNKVYTCKCLAARGIKHVGWSEEGEPVF